MSLVLRIGARGIRLLVGAHPGDVSGLTTPKTSDLILSVVLVATIGIGVESWPGVGILLRLIVGVRHRGSWLLIGWLDRGWLP